MPQTLALIHTSPVLTPVFTALCNRILPDLPVFHMVDESLIKNTIAAGRLEKKTVRRLVAHIESAFEAGASAVLVTCSSIGPAVNAARALFDGPIFRIDEAMADAAVRQGSRIGVLATLRTTLEPTVQLLRDTAAAQGVKREISAQLCEGAFDAVLRGDTATHDRLVSTSLTELLRQVDVVVLAQASMARVVEQIPAAERRVPILSSPELAIQQVRQTLGWTDANAAAALPAAPTTSPPAPSTC